MKPELLSGVWTDCCQRKGLSSVTIQPWLQFKVEGLGVKRQNRKIKQSNMFKESNPELGGQQLWNEVCWTVRCLSDESAMAWHLQELVMTESDRASACFLESTQLHIIYFEHGPPVICRPTFPSAMERWLVQLASFQMTSGQSDAAWREGEPIGKEVEAVKILKLIRVTWILMGIRWTSWGADVVLWQLDFPFITMRFWPNCDPHVLTLTQGESAS